MMQCWRPCARRPTGGLLRDALLFDVYKPKQVRSGGVAARTKKAWPCA